MSWLEPLAKGVAVDRQRPVRDVEDPLECLEMRAQRVFDGLEGDGLGFAGARKSSLANSFRASHKETSTARCRLAKRGEHALGAALPQDRGEQRTEPRSRRLA